MLIKKFLLAGILIVIIHNTGESQNQTFNQVLDSAKKMINVYFISYQNWQYTEPIITPIGKKQPITSNKKPGQVPIKKSEGDSRSSITSNFSSFIPNLDKPEPNRH